MTLSVVTWLWGDLYSIDHVNKSYNMVKRNLDIDFDFFCITDKPESEDFISKINTMPIWEEFGQTKFNYRRLNILSSANSSIFGDKILQIDIDIIIIKNITNMITDDDFKIWKCPSKCSRGFMYNTSFMLFKNGVLNEVYEKFKECPEREIQQKRSQGWLGTDQAIISKYVHPCKYWDESDGIYSMKEHKEMHANEISSDIKIAGLYGRRFDPAKFTHFEWVRENWR